MLAVGPLKSGLGKLLSQPQLLGTASKCMASAGLHTTPRTETSLGEAIQYLWFKYYHNPRHHLDNDKWAKIFAIEGNIKCGKGAFAEEFSNRLDLRYFPSASTLYLLEARPHVYPKDMVEYYLRPDSVQNKIWNISLDKVFTEPENWQNMGRYQLAMTKSRFFQYSDALSHLLRTGQGAVIERSFQNISVFRHAFRKMKWMDKAVHLYLYQLETIMSDRFITPQVMIYLDVPPEQCLENIKATGTPAEKHITLDFLKAMDEAYQTKVIPEAKSRGTNVIELDWSTPKPVEQVILDLDEMPTLFQEDKTRWSKNNSELKRVLRENSDTRTLMMISHLFCPIEEMWDPDWAEWAYEKYKEVTPFKYRTGFNAHLGDKNIWLKT